MNLETHRFLFSVYFSLTRKSSCVNARGIPTAAYQVLLGGVPPPPIGVPPCPGLTGGTRGGVPPAGVAPWPGLMGGGLPEVAYPPWVTPHQGTPQPGLTEGGYPPVGVPPIRVPPWLDLARVPPSPRCGQTENITFPRTTYAVGN